MDFSVSFFVQWSVHSAYAFNSRTEIVSNHTLVDGEKLRYCVMCDSEHIAE